MRIWVFRERCAAFTFICSGVVLTVYVVDGTLSQLQQGEAEATLKTATSLSKFKQTDFSSAPNHAAMKPIANWMSFATNRECWKAIVKNFVEKKYR